MGYWLLLCQREQKFRCIYRAQPQNPSLWINRQFAVCTDSLCGALIHLKGEPMAGPYSQDLRMRVVEAVEGGGSRREVAELYGISPSVVVIWMQRWAETGSIEAKQSGGSVSPLDEHAEFLLGLIVERPDMTLDEIVVAMSRAGIEGSRTAVWRFYERHEISFKKKTLYAAEQKRADVVRAR
jgi:transposase